MRLAVISAKQVEFDWVEENAALVFPQARIERISGIHEIRSQAADDTLHIYVLVSEPGWADGLALIKAIRSACADCRLILFVGEELDSRTLAALEAGADGYVLKSSQASWMLPAALVAAEKQYRRHQQVLAQADKYRTLFEESPLGMFRMTPEGQILDANPALIELLGYPDRERLTSRQAVGLYADPAVQARIIDRLRTAGYLRRSEVELRRADGTRFPARLNARLVRGSAGQGDFLEGSLEEIQPAEAGRRPAAPAEQFAGTILSSLGVGVVVFDRQLRCASFNRYMEEMTGLRADQVIGLVADDVLPYLQESGIDGLLLQALHGETVVAQDKSYWILETDREGWYTATYSPHRDAAGEIIGVVATIHDSTDRKTADKERERLLTAERSQRTRAETLGRVSMALSAVLDLPTLLELICQESADLFSVDSAHVWLVQDEYLVGFAGYGRERERINGLRIHLEDPDHIGVMVLRKRSPLYINDTHDSSQLRTGMSSIFRVQSILAVPLLIGNRAIGALQIVDNTRIDRFGPRDLDVAMQLGSHAATAVENARLYDDLHRAKEHLELAYDSTLEGWAKALEMRDSETEGHSQRVTETTLRLAAAMGVHESHWIHIRRGALLHDIGKMGIPDSILNKPAPLDEREWAVMRRHPVYAYDMLAPIDYLRQALDIPYCHHERWDGEGYPRGLRQEEIPLDARMFAVVDVWDALNSDRPYRKAWHTSDTLQYIQDQSGRHFDPRVVDTFLSLLNGH